MPNYFAQPNPWQVMAGAGGQADLSQLPMMIQRNRLMQQQMLMRQQQIEYQRKLAEQHGELFRAQSEYQKKRAETEGQKLNQSKALMDTARTVGQATTLSKMLQGGGDMGLGTPAALGLMQSGALPEGGGQFTREDLVNALNAIAAGGATESAVSQPASAQRLMEGYNIPEGAVRGNSIEGVTQYGMPKPQKKDIRSVGPGGLFDADTGTMLVPPRGNEPKPMTQGEAVRARMAEGGRTFKQLPDEFRLAIDRAFTNAPSQMPSNEVQTDQFDSEEHARGIGKKSGDVVYIKGVGKVRLN